jgi:dTMP kinase
MAEPGYFITFEGGDGAGKSTLIDELYQTLTARGKRVLKTRAPGATEAGKAIRSIVLSHGEIPISASCELFLYLADRAQHVESVILPALQRGEIVLCDRYNDSTIAYQGVGRELGFQEVEMLCRFATHGLDPDLTLYLDLDPRIGMERINAMATAKDRIEAEGMSFHEKIRMAFLTLASMHPKRMHVIDASQTKSKVFEDSLKVVDANVP